MRLKSKEAVSEGQPFLFAICDLRFTICDLRFAIFSSPPFIIPELRSLVMTAPYFVCPALHDNINEKEDKNDDYQGRDTSFIHHFTLLMILNL